MASISPTERKRLKEEIKRELKKELCEKLHERMVAYMPRPRGTGPYGSNY